MAELLKHMYNPAFFDRLCVTLKKTVPLFDERKFIRRIYDRQWPDLELKQRTRHVTLALHGFLPPDFTRACTLLVAISNDLRQRNEKEQSYPFIFLPDYIALYGESDFEASMKAIEQITQLVSAEFAIRPFIIRYPAETMHQMGRWSGHAEPSVRRLSSEGCRPRLPWGMGIPSLKKDPSPILPILENLKADPSDYVRRSVANNLNDIAKDHPSLVLEIAGKWKGKNPDTDWIIRHGCRSLLKSGSVGALSLQGFDTKTKSAVDMLTVSKKVSIGEYFFFGFIFRNLEKKTARVRLEYAIDYITSTGKISRKIFQIGESAVTAGDSIEIKRKQSFKNFTTRKHFRGRHLISILVNGVVKASKPFSVQ